MTAAARFRARLHLPDGRSPSLGTYPTWDEADGVARAAVEELGGAPGARAAVELVDERATPPALEGLLSARDAAALLGVSLSTFKDTVRAELPAVSIGRRVLFDRKDLEAWARGHKAAGRSESLPAAAGRSTSSGSVTLASASNAQRAAQILERLRKKQRASTRTR